ncbi:MAG: hypothetical protein IT548_07620 [Alphaproteobacteria bacterium]|nr:hypothetical protein [Alphaproteobacteria bacterium]
MTDEKPLEWDSDLRLFGSIMIGQWSVAMAVTALVMTLLMGTVFAAQGEWAAIGMIAMIAAGAAAGLWLLGFAVMALVFRGRVAVHYRIDSDGITVENRDRVVHGANRAAIVVGALAGKPGLTGAGLIGRSREQESVRWSGGFRAVTDRRRTLIQIRNAWRTVLLVQCTPENFEAASARIREAMARHGTEGRAGRRSPLPFYLAHGLLVLAAAVPLFWLSEEYDISLLLPLLVVAFAEATLWLINLFGWVVLALLTAMAAGVLIDLSELRTSQFVPGRTYSGFDVLGGDDVTGLVVAAIGAGYLAWLSVAGLRGRFLALLVRDAAETG